MPWLGSHLSVAGGLRKAPEAATALGMATVQLFTHSPSQWAVPADGGPGKKLADDEVRAFREAVKAGGLRTPTAHDSYLINLASPDETLWRRSLAATVAELERAETLGLSYLVMHPGTPTDGDDEAGLTRIARGLDEAHRRCAGFSVRILLETTAGQGKTLGHRFEHLRALRDRVAAPDRVGVCLDTCHVFAAGYPLAPKAAYEATFAEFDDVAGFEHLCAVHVNDSLKPFASRVDRHAHIGQGEMGLEPFRLLMNDPRFAELPLILETPKEGDDGEAMDPINLATLASLVTKRKKGRNTES